MNRSTGVTVSAALSFVGSAFILLFVVFAAFGTALIRVQQPQVPFLRYILYGTIALYLAFAVWGIATGVGLLRLREWARISTVIFSILLLLCMVPALVFLFLIPIPARENVPSQIALFVRLGEAVFDGALVALGAVWVYYFNRRTVRDEFRRSSSEPAGEHSAAKRPLSISIIGWILVIGGISGGLGAAILAVLHFPLFLGGYIFSGTAAGALMISWGVAQLSAGAGLLRLRSWGWILAVVTLSAGALNAVLTILVPGSAARLRDATELMLQRLGMPATGMPVTPSFWLGATFGMVFVGVQLWFLIARRRVFYPGNFEASPPE